MHEGAVCREIMDITEAAAKANALLKVYEIVVAHGPYSGVQENQLNFYFEIARKGTVMEDAVIRMVLDESLQGTSQIYVRSIKGD